MADRDQLLALDDAGLLARCELTAACGSGPGGQKRNKTATAVRLKLKGSLLAVSDCSERSFFRNRARALWKMRLAIAAGERVLPALLPPRPDCAPTHPDYPLNVARLLDVLAEVGYVPKNAAAIIGTTPSALIKKISRDPWLWQVVNRERLCIGLAPLRLS